MANPFLQARALAPRTAPEPVCDPSVLEAYLEDASASPKGDASGLVRVTSEEEAAAYLRATLGSGVRLLPQAARSSLTGGAVPRGEVIVSVERLSEVGTLLEDQGGASVRVQAGVRLKDLQREVGGRGFYYPPVPTYQEAMLGGTAATNAGGAASFKYGVTRDWVHGLRVVLFNGDLLVLERGEACARRGESFRIGLSDGRELMVPVPDYRLPPLKKISAGYFASDPLDLVDLFVGSEGTLGLITEVTVRLVPLPVVVTALAFFESFEQAFSLSSALRAAATRRGDRASPDVRAIESMDGACLDLLRHHGDARRLRVRVPDRARASLFFEVELAERVSDDEALTVLQAVLDGRPIPESSLARLFHILREHGALEDLELALPDDASRQQALLEFREAVPKRVNEILAARRLEDPGVQKVGGDLIVPFDRLPEMVRIYGEGFAKRGLAFAIWGHVSDGNLHPNALPRDAREVALGFEALMEFALEAVRRGGCPLSEHGVGRNPVKQEMLRRFLGDGAIASMRRIKKALDPEGRFAPGVIFPVP